MSRDLLILVVSWQLYFLEWLIFGNVVEVFILQPAQSNHTTLNYTKTRTYVRPFDRVYYKPEKVPNPATEDLQATNKSNNGSPMEEFCSLKSRTDCIHTSLRRMFATCMQSTHTQKVINCLYKKI